MTSVKQIEQTIGEINAIAGSIAAAVEEQGAATAEIARNVAETAAAADTMTTRTTQVSSEATQIGRRAGDSAGVDVNSFAGGFDHKRERLPHSPI